MRGPNGAQEVVADQPTPVLTKDPPPPAHTHTLTPQVTPDAGGSVCPECRSDFLEELDNEQIAPEEYLRVQ